MNWLLAVLVLLNLVIVVVFLRIFSLIMSFKSQIRDIFVPEDEKTSSKFYQVVDILINRAGICFANHTKTALMGKISGQSRLASAVVADVAEDELEASQPALSGLLELAGPRTKRRLVSNPAIMDLFARAMGGINKGNSNHDNSGNSDYGERVGKYNG